MTIVGVGHRPGRKAATGARDARRSRRQRRWRPCCARGATGRIVGHDALAPSTVGTCAGVFTLGHVRQLGL